MDSVEDIARRVVEGHAFIPHVLKNGEFGDEKLGPVLPITTREAFQQHIVAVLESTETLCCTVYSTTQQTAQADLFYHPMTNTLVIVPASDESEATAYRPDKGLAYFARKVEYASKAEERVIPIVNSIYELRLELAAAKEAQRIKEADDKLREAVERRFLKERQDMLDRHERELKHSPNASADTARHAKELRALEEQKEKDFERYKREREDARRLQERGKERERTEQKQKDGPVLGRGRIR